MGLSVLRLNVGCARTHLRGFVNLDRSDPADLPEDTTRPVEQVTQPGGNFVQADALALPFRPDTFAEVRCSHFVEHLSWDGELQAFLAEVARVLARGGEFRAVFPDTVALARAAEAGELRDVAKHWWGDLPPEDADLRALQLLNAAGHKTLLTGKTFAGLVSRHLTVFWNAQGHTETLLIARKAEVAHG